MATDVIKILFPAALSFFIGIAMTPFLAKFLYARKMWKKTSVVHTIDGGAATITSKLHNDEERKTPRMGGIIIWGSVSLTIAILWLFSIFFPTEITGKLNFLSRDQTWLPVFTLLAGALCGLVDDYLVCRDRGTYRGGGLSLKTRLLFVFLLGLLGSYWFYFKLDITSIFIPFFGNLHVGVFLIPIFIIFIIGIYSGGIIDGIDGLSGGVFASIYAAYAVIAFSNGQINIATYASVVVGGILAFLWFNIPPARFFCSETGTMALTTSLVVLAFLTNAVAVLPIIAFLLVVTSASSIIQITSKKYRGGKKVFLVAPLHNHFQALGWPAYKVTMRYWVIGLMLAVIGVIIQLIG
ncbi:MAG: Phospho-N-acetylmuramoyl-pentapeptide-transferase [Parcubacteria group bacterium GW2011_GWA2_47_7]|nr:MAG: Phospho-N-acetylmuramoyl-pentapeptide-transferase [Parcubacteria group bacterium GW2011_GWA2_47_7]